MNNLIKVTKKNKTENLLNNLQYSDFGEIKKIMHSIFTNEELENEYKLPKILMIGGESTGKSSVLENITKCHIFPRDKSVCTKCPVRIQLHNGNTTNCKIYSNNKENEIKDSHIYEYLKQYMDSLVDITDEEIILHIMKNNYPNIELYDLPGIVAYPPEKSKKSIELIKKYLAENNSIIICTIPATSERINGHQSISLIKEFKREVDTILVLTKIDRVHDDDIKSYIADRILKEDDELKELEIPFCLGIQNRIHKDNISLSEVDDVETDTINYIMDYITNDTECAKYDKHIQNIENSLGVDNLLKIICDKYMSYVIDKWIPKIIQKINNNIKLLEDEIVNIGFNFCPISIDQLVNDKLTSILFNNIQNYISDYNNLLKLKDNILFMNSNIDIIKNHLSNINITEIIDNTLNDLIKVNSLVFSGNTHTNLNIYRYQKVIEFIRNQLNNLLINNYKILTDSINNIIIIYQTNHLIHGSVNMSIFHNFMISNLRYTIEDKVNIETIPEDKIVESDEVLEMREIINKKITSLEKNIKKLKKIKQD